MPENRRNFEILREVGRGGSSIVYEARQHALGRSVALKRLPAAALFDERWLARFRNEIRTVAQLSHPNIVPFYEAGCDDDSYYYTMQLVEGISLAEVIRSLRRCHDNAADSTPPCHGEAADALHPAMKKLCELSQCMQNSSAVSPVAKTDSHRDGSQCTPAGHSYSQTVAAMILQAARALDYAHEQGVLHLDIKPSNLLLDGAGKLWVTDFGAAQWGSDYGSSPANPQVGTLQYMSPEQSAGTVPLDRRSDIYSLGVTLYELLTLERPDAVGHGANVPAKPVADSHCTRQQKFSIPDELTAVVERATAKRPDDRYATAAELAADLQRYLDRELSPIRPSDGLRGAAYKLLLHRRSVVIGVSASLLVAGVMFASILDRYVKPMEPTSDQTDRENTALQQLALGQTGAVAAVSVARRENAMTDQANQALRLMRQNQLPEALQLLRDNWAWVRRARGTQHAEAIVAGLRLARLLRDQGDYGEAAQIGQQNLAAARQSLDKEHTLRGEATIERVLALRALKRRDEAAALEMEEFPAIFKKEETASDHELLATVFLEDGKLADAEQWARSTLDMQRQAPSPAPPISCATTLNLLGRILIAAGKREEAEPVLRESLTIRQQALPVNHWLIAETEQLLRH